MLGASGYVERHGQRLGQPIPRNAKKCLQPCNEPLSELVQSGLFRRADLDDALGVVLLGTRGEGLAGKTKEGKILDAELMAAQMVFLENWLGPDRGGSFQRISRKNKIKAPILLERAGGSAGDDLEDELHTITRYALFGGANAFKKLLKHLEEKELAEEERSRGKELSELPAGAPRPEPLERFPRGDDNANRPVVLQADPMSEDRMMDAPTQFRISNSF